MCHFVYQNMYNFFNYLLPSVKLWSKKIVCFISLFFQRFFTNQNVTFKFEVEGYNKKLSMETKREWIDVSNSKMLILFVNLPPEMSSVRENKTDSNFHNILSMSAGCKSLPIPKIPESPIVYSLPSLFCLFVCYFVMLYFVA